jgi:uncharacterized protein YbbC (DUF1343 family)
MLPSGVDALIDAKTPARVTALRGSRLGLVTNDLALTSGFRRGRAALHAAGWRFEVLFAPEHGLSGRAREGAHIADEVDPVTRAPVRSLYGEQLAPSQRDLAGLDAVLLDLPDVGARFYTYVWTMSHTLEACATAGIPLVVLDRPNPIGGDLDRCEGPILDERCQSFVGRWPIPIRHGLTMGELARHFARVRGIDVEVVVVPAPSWRRAHDARDESATWMPPSPNLPGPVTTLLYPGTCLAEAVNLAEGRSTAHAFRTWAAPFLDADRLADDVNAQRMPGVHAVPYGFTPAVRDHAGEACEGILLMVTDADAIRPVHTGVRILSTIERLHPGALVERRGIDMPGESAVTAFEKLFGRLGSFAEVTAGAWDDPATLAVPEWRDLVEPDLLYR